MNDANLTFPERLLAAEVARLLADFLLQTLTSEGGELYNLGQSNFEMACHALNHMGVLAQAGHYTRHRLVIPADQIASHVHKLDALSRQTFDLLLAAYVENYCGYDRLSAFRAWFAPDPMDQRVMSLLARCDYVEESNGRFRWADKVAPIMRACGAWDDLNICQLELRQNRQDAILDHLERTLPYALRRKFLARLGGEDLNDTLALMQSHLAGMSWQYFPVPSQNLEKAVSRGCALLLLKLVDEV